MNKTDLVDTVAKVTKLSKKESEGAINAVLDSITDALANDEKVVLVGFGTFEVRSRAARKGRNPSTKEEIKIPASKAPVFKAGKVLKERSTAEEVSPLTRAHPNGCHPADDIVKSSDELKAPGNVLFSGGFFPAMS